MITAKKLYFKNLIFQKFFQILKTCSIYLLCFFLSRISFSDGIFPFPMSLFVFCFSKNFNPVAIGISCLTGIASTSDYSQLILNFISLLIFCSINTFTKNNLRSSLVFQSALSMISVFFTQFFFLFSSNFLMSDFFKAVFYSLIVFFATYLFSFIFNNVSSFNIKNLNYSQFICLFSAVCISLSSISSFSILGFSISVIILFLTVLFISYKEEVGISTISSLIAAFSLFIYLPVNVYIIPAAAGAVIFSSFFKPFGKIPFLINYIFSYVLLSLFLGNFSNSIFFIKEIITCSVIFAFLPKKILEHSIFIQQKSHPSPVSSFHFKKDVTNRLSLLSESLNSLSASFDKVSKANEELNQDKRSSMVNRIAGNVCKDCSVKNFCWEKNFIYTYKAILQMISSIEKTGSVCCSDIPEEFLSKCCRTTQLICSTSSTYELYSLDALWKRRMEESRSLISKQLSGLSSIVTSLCDNIQEENISIPDIEEKIVSILDSRGIKVKSICVLKNSLNRFSSFISIFPATSETVYVCEEVLSKVLNIKMKYMQYRECKTKDTFYFCEEEHFSVFTGVASTSKQDSPVSGDNYSFSKSDNGKYILALSDGMGSGQSAAKSSDAAVSLFENFLNTGLSKEVAINMINSILILKSNFEEFATVDLATVDLYTGCLELAKLGSAPTFLKRKDKVSSYNSISLPVGVLEEISYVPYNITLENGDILIMLTDGVTDSLSEKEIEKILETISSNNPQTIADKILYRAIDNKEATDDMTVVVSKIWKKVS